MIRVELFFRDGFFIGLRSTGHASNELGGSGSNVVCAAVSALIQTLFVYLKKQKLISNFHQEKGTLQFQLIDIRNPKLTVLVDHSYKLILTGLEEIRNLYPKELELEFRELMQNKEANVL